MMFTKAVKSKTFLRSALFGPSGAGKTKSALRIASGMASKIENCQIGLIDSERGSASLYADEFDFVTVDLDDKSINGYVSMIEAAKNVGIKILIIDSGSHAWQFLLEEVDRIARANFSGNTWAAWQKGTPLQRKFIDAIVSYPGHIIMTMRSKTEWNQETTDKGKLKPVRVGLAPEQGKNIEYEFSFLIEINSDHFATVIKDRSGKFQDMVIDKPGEEFGEQLIDWLNSGSDVVKTKIDITSDMRLEDALALIVLPGDMQIISSQIKQVKDFYVRKAKRLAKDEKFIEGLLAQINKFAVDNELEVV